MLLNQDLDTAHLNMLKQLIGDVAQERFQKWVGPTGSFYTSLVGSGPALEGHLLGDEGSSLDGHCENRQLD